VAGRWRHRCLPAPAKLGVNTAAYSGDPKSQHSQVERSTGPARSIQDYVFSGDGAVSTGAGDGRSVYALGDRCRCRRTDDIDERIS
jgi:hypothetical protein